MSELSSMCTSLFFLFFIINVSFLNGESTEINKPFWINPCGDSLKNNEESEEEDIIDRILNLAKYAQNNINDFKFNYIKNVFGFDYFTHYKSWVEVNNSWMTPRLLNSAEDDLPGWWLSTRSFPEELKFTYKILQRVAVGFELLLEDAKKYGSSENCFLSNFVSCKSSLQQLLCEIRDSIYITRLKKPIDITREIVPDEVRLEKDTAKKHLINSIIFRDYMIAIKYILNTYGDFKKRLNLSNNSININDALLWNI